MSGWVIKDPSRPVAVGEPSWLCQGPGTSTEVPLSRRHLGTEWGGDGAMIHTRSHEQYLLLPLRVNAPHHEQCLPLRRAAARSQPWML